MTGKNVKCAVAFWGEGACEEFFNSKRACQNAQIICDLTMGGTNPEELKRLGAPTAANLRHHEGLHAKLYMSDTGLVVASANASNRAIGFHTEAVLTECGTYHKPGTKAFRDAEKWFVNLWKISKPIDQDALKGAKRAWGQRNRPSFPGNHAISASPESLLFKIATEPEKYRGIGIVFTSGEADQEEVNTASKAAVAADDELPKPALPPDVRSRLSNWPKEHLFTGWTYDEANAWPKRFLCAHRGPRGGLRYLCYERFGDPVETGPNQWSIFADRSEKLRTDLGLAAGVRKAAQPDTELLGSIFKYLNTPSSGVENPGHCLCETPYRLDNLLGQVGNRP